MKTKARQPYIPGKSPSSRCILSQYNRKMIACMPQFTQKNHAELFNHRPISNQKLLMNKTLWERKQVNTLVNSMANKHMI